MSPRFLKPIFGVVLLAIIFTVASLTLSQAAAHGSLVGPASRNYACNAEHPRSPETWACQLAIQVSGSFTFNNWPGINQLADGDHKAFVPDGQLCAGGDPLYAGLNLARDDWPTTVIEEGTTSFDFDFYAWVPHDVRYMDFYITKEDHDPFEPLKWSDLEDEPFCRHTDPALTDDDHFIMSCDLPERSGRHIIYNIWQRNGAEAFYGCSDVFFVDENNPAPIVTTPTLGQCDAHPWLNGMVYFADEFVLYDGKEWQARWMSNDDIPGEANVWEEVGVCDGEPVATPTPITPTPTPAPTTTPEPPSGAWLRLPEASVQPTERVTVTLAGNGLDTLASAMIHVDYDESVVSPVSCTADPNSTFDLGICNIQSATQRVTLSLLDGTGESGDHDLAQLVFEAVGDHLDLSVLSISAETFADTNGQPLPVSVDDGEITVLLTSGDVNCDQASDVIDALFVLQYTVGARSGGSSCPPTANELYLAACDVDGDNACTVVDGLFVLQCTVGVNNALCPAPQSLSQRLGTASVVNSADLNLSINHHTDTVEANLQAAIPETNPVGAAMFVLEYDSSLLSVTSCKLGSDLMGVCNPEYAPGLLAISLVSTDELSGEVELGVVTFSAENAGEASFDLAAPTYRSAAGLELPVESAQAVAQVSHAATAIQLDQMQADITTSHMMLIVSGMLAVVGTLSLRHSRKK